MPEDVGKEAEKWLLQKGVTILYNTVYLPSMDKDYDLVIKTTGQKYNSDFLKTNFTSSVAPNGQVFVNEYLQVAKSDPRVGNSAAVADNIFAVGDCTWTKYKEEKNISSIMALANNVGANIRSLDSGSKVAAKLDGQVVPLTAFISLGPEYAVMIMGGNIAGNKDIGLSKAGILVGSMQNFRQAPAAPVAAK
jgi:NADH dehydrogenase FAD-containing subunit